MSVIVDPQYGWPLKVKVALQVIQLLRQTPGRTTYVDGDIQVGGTDEPNYVGAAERSAYEVLRLYFTGEMEYPDTFPRCCAAPEEKGEGQSGANIRAPIA